MRGDHSGVTREPNRCISTPVMAPNTIVCEIDGGLELGHADGGEPRSGLYPFQDTRVQAFRRRRSAMSA
jgi:hypothetical protein